MRGACICFMLFLVKLLVNCDRRKKADLAEYYYSYEGKPPVDDYGVPYDIKENMFELQGDLPKKFIFEAAALGPDDSLVCSPLSALLPLGKLIFGAKDKSKTLKELLKAIGVDNIEKVPRRFKRILSNMRRLPGVDLSIASRIYLDEKLIKKLNYHYKQLSKQVFKFSIEGVDMEHPEEVVNKINHWVKEQTNGTIPQMLRPNDLSPDVGLMLVNAIHFKGNWETPFKKVKPMTFYGSKGERVLPMMKITEDIFYGESKTLDAKAVEVPYNGSKASFLIVLPNSRTGLSLMLKELRLAPNLLNTIKMEKMNVKLSLPEFKIETEIDLKSLYKKSGLKEIFSGKTGFEHIVIGERVKVDRGRQKALIEVTAEGTEAGAASAVEIMHMSLVETKHFKADHPFLFFIMANRQQVFAGIFTAA